MRRSHARGRLRWQATSCYVSHTARKTSALVELKFRAGVETTVGELAAATTSGVGLAKKQSKVFDPGGGL
jgi:hypothetical protein